MDDASFDPGPRLALIRAAQERLRQTAAEITDARVGEPSLLPGWTRGHVLAHVEANADSLVNLLDWARTGVETPQYASLEARDAYIEEHAGRTAAEHLRAIQAADDRFVSAAERHPADRWEVDVTWRGGATRPARAVLWARLREVEIHHVDLDLGYTAARWSDEFTDHVLRNVADAFFNRDPQPLFDLHAVDTDNRWQIGDEPAPVTVSGAQAAITAWIIGRSNGDGLHATGPDGERVALPIPPPWA